MKLNFAALFVIVLLYSAVCTHRDALLTVVCRYANAYYVALTMSLKHLNKGGCVFFYKPTTIDYRTWYWLSDVSIIYY